MNLDDARAVLEWLGSTSDPVPTFEHNGGDSWTVVTVTETEDYEAEVRADFRTDANWIHGILIPALAERLGCAKYGIQHRKGQVIVVLDLPRKDSYDLGMDLVYGYGPTFEAAVISAAAKAIRGME